jgi:hypothetical protein
MKAIISFSQTSHGEFVNLLGMGDNESHARRVAFSRLHNGHNDYDEEYTGGLCVSVSDDLAKLYKLLDDDFVTYNESGEIVGIEAVDTVSFRNAEQCLFVEDGTLKTSYKRG